MGVLAIAGTLILVMAAMAITWAATFGLELAARLEKQARDDEFLQLIKGGGK